MSQFENLKMKSALLVCFLCLICASAIAQVSFGVKGGVNFNEMVYTPVPKGFSIDNNSGIGFHLGFYSSLKIGQNFLFIPELQLSQRGVSVSSGGSTSNFNIHYLELPLLFSYRLKKLGLDIGPNISFRISSKVDVYEGFDFGLNGGLRFDLTERFFLTGRYYYGLTDISTIEFRDPFNNLLTRTGERSRSVQFGIGYKIK
ncbi:MAG: porin family protein [Cytophagales bacterium]